jgi:hypothetical protein
MKDEQISENQRNHLVVLVHGINTRALWIGLLKPTLEDCGFTIAPASFGVLRVGFFLLPIPWFRNNAVKSVLRDVKTAITIHKPDLISVIAHSFGTYVIARIVAEEPDLQWHRIIFCGSVVSQRFPLYQYLGRFKHPILNEVGTRDIWPAMAESVTWGYGSVGSYGFNKPPVETRWHRGFHHSDFLTDEFCRSYWVPFLRDGSIKRGDPPDFLPWWTRIITLLPLRWVIVATITAILVLWGRPLFSNISNGGDWSLYNCRDLADEADRAFDVDKSDVSRAKDLISCKNPRGYNLRGRERFFSHDYGTAERFFSKAVHLLPKNASEERKYDWEDNLANTEIETGNTSNAIRMFEDLLKDGYSPNSVKWDLARAYLYAQDYKMALTLVGEVGVTFAGMTHPGKVEILEAAALVGETSRSNINDDDKEKQLMRARDVLCRGILRSENFWRGVLSEKLEYTNASFREEIRLAKEIGGGSIKCPPPY